MNATTTSYYTMIKVERPGGEIENVRVNMVMTPGFWTAYNHKIVAPGAGRPLGYEVITETVEATRREQRDTLAMDWEAAMDDDRDATERGVYSNEAAPIRAELDAFDAAHPEILAEIIAERDERAAVADPRGL